MKYFISEKQEVAISIDAKENGLKKFFGDLETSCLTLDEKTEFFACKELKETNKAEFEKFRLSSRRNTSPFTLRLLQRSRNNKNNLNELSLEERSKLLFSARNLFYLSDDDGYSCFIDNHKVLLFTCYEAAKWFLLHGKNSKTANYSVYPEEWGVEIKNFLDWLDDNHENFEKLKLEFNSGLFPSEMTFEYKDIQHYYENEFRIEAEEEYYQMGMHIGHLGEISRKRVEEFENFCKKYGFSSDFDFEYLREAIKEDD